MYASKHSWTEKGMVLAEIYASEEPEELPLTTDDVDGVSSGYRLAPGSTFYVVTTGSVFILGTELDWVEQ